MAVDMGKIVSLCKRRGFIFQSSEIYGGLSGTWDYGPLGVELKRNIKERWWKSVVHEREDMVGLDAAILMHPSTWKASGHLESFADLMVDCLGCKKRFRKDNLKALPLDPSSKGFSKVYPLGLADRKAYPVDKENKCPECGGALTEPRKFNLMFKTFIGPVEDEGAAVYLRPETAQGIFVNFCEVHSCMRRKLPFGIAQIGKAFRNEVTTGNFIFRCREFEQMEIEYFVKPGTDEEKFNYWLQERLNWYIKLGITKEHLRLRRHEPDELAHYAKACYDIEYLFPMGWSELEGIANRADFDLKQHAKFSGKELDYYDEETKSKIIPYVIEPSAGVDRTTLAILLDSYREEEVRGEKRVVLGFTKEIAPLKVAVLPLLRNRVELVAFAKKIYEGLRTLFPVAYDDTGSIGRLYRRQDEIGTCYCITVDVQSLEDKAVTIRDRDTMLQERIPVKNLKRFLSGKLSNQQEE